MTKSKSIKFKIEITSHTLPKEDIVYLNEKLSLFLDSISDITKEVNVHKTMVSEEGFPKFIKNYHDFDDDPEKQSDLTNNINKFKEKFDKEKEEFDKYLNSFPNYKKTDFTGRMKLMKDFLIRNKTARLSEILQGCREKGFKSKARKDHSALFLTLQKMIKGGYVTKNGMYYTWNYEKE
jgi:hypothetical protein